MPAAPTRSQRWRLPLSTSTPASGLVTIPATPNPPTTSPTSQSGSPSSDFGISTTLMK